MSIATLKKRELGAVISCHRKKSQAKWLNDNGLPFLCDVDGWPIVSESLLRDRLGEGGQTVANIAAEPDFSALLSNS